MSPHKISTSSAALSSTSKMLQSTLQHHIRTTSLCHGHSVIRLLVLHNMTSNFTTFGRGGFQMFIDENFCIKFWLGLVILGRLVTTGIWCGFGTNVGYEILGFHFGTPLTVVTNFGLGLSVWDWCHRFWCWNYCHKFWCHKF